MSDPFQLRSRSRAAGHRPPSVRRLIHACAIAAAIATVAALASVPAAGASSPHTCSAHRAYNVVLPGEGVIKGTIYWSCRSVDVTGNLWVTSTRRNVKVDGAVWATSDALGFVQLTPTNLSARPGHPAKINTAWKRPVNRPGAVGEMFVGIWVNHYQVSQEFSQPVGH